jgi:hypothetical protein
MDAKRTILDGLKERNPFKTPEGYLEGLAGRVMSSLPENPRREARVISLYDRVRPWLYLAAMFAGLFFLFKTLIHPRGEDALPEQPLFGKTSPTAVWAVSPEDDNDEYLEYLEHGFYNDAFTEVMEHIY